MKVIFDECAAMKKWLIVIFLTILSTILSIITAEDARPLNAPEVTQQIKITDSKNAKDIFITDPGLINRFNYFWSQKAPLLKQKLKQKHKQKQNLKQQQYQWRYQITIQNSIAISTWVYDPKGYTKQLSLKQTGATYKLTAIRAFNRFLKMDKS